MVILCPLWSYSVHSVHFDPLQSYLSHSLHFGPFFPLCFYSVHSVHFSPIQFTLLLLGPGPVYQLRSYLVQFGLVCSILSTLVYSFLFSPPCSYSGPILSIWSTFLYLIQFGPFRLLLFILVHFDLSLCTYITGKDMFELKAPNLNLNLLKNK